MPLDFAKTTIQCGSSQPVRQVLKAAVQQHGPAGLFRGMVSLTSLCLHIVVVLPLHGLERVQFLIFSGQVA